MICQSCGLDIPNTANFCTSCGAPVGEKSASISGNQPTKKCPYCGELILAVAKKCKHCGEIVNPASRQSSPSQPAQSQVQPKRGIGRLGVFGILVAVVFGIIIIGIAITLFLAKIAPEESKTSIVYSGLDSSAQRGFHYLNLLFAQEFKSAKNEIQQSSAFNKCNAARAIALRKGSYRVTNWIGTITSIKTDQGGDVAHVEIESAIANFKITYMNEPISIFGSPYETHIGKGTKVYNQLGALSVGHKVTFSARFLSDPNRGVKETSLTERGCVEEPEFILEFYDISSRR